MWNGWVVGLNAYLIKSLNCFQNSYTTHPFLTCLYHSLSTSLLFAPRCSRLLYFALNQSSNKSCLQRVPSLFIKNKFRSQELSTNWAHFYRVTIPRCSQVSVWADSFSLSFCCLKHATRNSIATRKLILPTTWGSLEASDDNANCQHHDYSFLRDLGKDLPKSSTDCWPTETKMINMCCYKPQNLWSNLLSKKTNTGGAGKKCPQLKALMKIWEGRGKGRSSSWCFGYSCWKEQLETGFSVTVSLLANH